MSMEAPKQERLEQRTKVCTGPGVHRPKETSGTINEAWLSTLIKLLHAFKGLPSLAHPEASYVSAVVSFSCLPFPPLKHFIKKQQKIKEFCENQRKRDREKRKDRRKEGRREGRKNILGKGSMPKS